VRPPARPDGLAREQQQKRRHRQERARQIARQKIRVVDLEGQVCWLLPEELRDFQRSCWAELELAEGSAWSVVRQHWRRSSLRWHPDHGGDPAVWLRKQRAYGALKNARAQVQGAAPSQAQPSQLGGRRRFWPWTWRRKPTRPADR
jgi:hypothetical protein